MADCRCKVDIFVQDGNVRLGKGGFEYCPLHAAAPRLLAALERLMVVGSAATGYLICKFPELHEYVEEIMGRPVFTHEMGDKVFSAQLKEKAHSDFVAAIEAAQAITAIAAARGENPSHAT